eukprot:CAMPEP_0170057350 /NCGR_PEP_ID=MMETSP0019_2-20121128/390_1 /TAXON_ID=98059 /ORGANISM="Dinobryon sp., Strain UTEXLB2267" /LENGTH=95 /DNA_ID=CAMNT_0010262037 /DNA_START=321 /DNA_END=608 /DNA_ORIENTATION=-
MAVQERKKEVSIPLPMEGIRTRTMELHPSSIECITWNGNHRLSSTRRVSASRNGGRERRGSTVGTMVGIRRIEFGDTFTEYGGDIASIFGKLGRK